MGYVQGKAKDISKRRIVGFGKEGLSGGGSTTPATDTSDKNVLLVHLATTTNVTLAGLFAIDGVVPDSGMLVLVWQQTDQTQNGVYEVSSGAWTKLYTDIGITKQPIVVVPVLGTANIAHQFNRISIDNLNNFIDIGSVYSGTTLPDGTVDREILAWDATTQQWAIPNYALLGDYNIYTTEYEGRLTLYKSDSSAYTNIGTTAFGIYPTGLSTRKFVYANDQLELRNSTGIVTIDASPGNITIDYSGYIAEHNYNNLLIRQGTNQLGLLDKDGVSFRDGTGGTWEDVCELNKTRLLCAGQTSTYCQKAIWDKDGEMVWVYDDYAELDSDYLLTANTYPTNASEFLIRTSFNAFYAVVTYDITVVFSSNTAISEGIEFQLKNSDSSTPIIFDMTGHENRHTEAATGESPVVSDINATNTVQYIPTNWGTLYTKVNFQGSFKIKSNADSDSGYIALFFRKITGTDLVTLKAGSNVKIDFYHA